MSAATTPVRRWLLWLPPLAVMALIFVLSSQSGLKVSEDPAIDRPFRVSGHLLVYAALAGLLVVALSGGRRPRLRHLAVALGISVLYGLSDELHQSFVPDRVGRIQDVGVDTVGALMGLVAATLVLTLSSTRKRRAPDRPGS